MTSEHLIQEADKLIKRRRAAEGIDDWFEREVRLSEIDEEIHEVMDLGFLPQLNERPVKKSNTKQG